MTKYIYRNGIPAISTFSIVAVDIEAQEIGVAVQSKFLAVGSAVPWVAADAGAVATQSWANTSFGPRGLALLREGLHPEEVLERLLADDANRESRQVGIVDLQGRSATFTGKECFDWAGGVCGPGYACQGNILAGENVVKDMEATFLATTGRLADRLLAALAAGQTAGGDRRGMQSAALYIAKPNGGYGGFNDRFIDLRVDDHAQPIQELERLLYLHRLYFERPREEDLVPLSGETLDEVRELLQRAGYQPGTGSEYSEVDKQALSAYYQTENFEERWQEDAVMDKQVLAYMQSAVRR
ncbi:MAG: DUF1028 domain-containing protein [Alicyclobacillus herbarius]|uniref:DUF1028 domain-containing protein n=1 Tax=Alicyclobacillus herbarius TaxID=122960 RepID=UPI00235720DB|nr:DUF1028 domain-containing protein [Alicyclobacillus herbarius]MCL6632537.1 DUF1028 domain-containing protein [Alicyclobacillus herbarius]